MTIGLPGMFAALEDIIIFLAAPMVDVERKLKQAIEGVNDFGKDNLTQGELGSSDYSSFLATQHSLAHSEYRDALVEVRADLQGFLDAFAKLKAELDDTDNQSATRMNKLVADLEAASQGHNGGNQ